MATAPMCKLCKTKHWLNQEHRLGSVVDAMTAVKPTLVEPTVSRSMNTKVVRPAKPDHVERTVVAKRVVALGDSIAADDARAFDDFAPLDVDVQVAAGTSLMLGFTDERMTTAPVAHVTGVASHTVAARTVKRGKAVGAGGLSHSPNSTTTTAAPDTKMADDNRETTVHFDWDARERELGLR